MSNIKKAFQPIVTFLEDNAGKKVGTIIDEVKEMCSRAAAGGGGKATTFFKDDDTGETLAIKCFYHKLWVSPRNVEFGAKASSPTGLNTLCKDGASKWTKQQRDYKQGKEELLDLVSAGEVSPEEIPARLEELEEAKNAIIPMEGSEQFFFETLEDCLADLGYEVSTTEVEAE